MTGIPEQSWFIVFCFAEKIKCDLDSRPDYPIYKKTVRFDRRSVISLPS